MKLTASNPHFVPIGELGISTSAGDLWSVSICQESNTEKSQYEGRFQKGEYFLIISDPMNFEVFEGMFRLFYKVIFGEKVYLVRVDDIINPYYNGPAT
jgi:hypothetical protein